MSMDTPNLPDWRTAKDGKSAADNRKAVGSYWWRLKDKEMWQGVLNAVHHIDQHQDHKYREVLRAVRMYDNASITSLAPGLYSRPDDVQPRRMRYNIVQATVDTATAHGAKDRPRPFALTDGGSYKKQSQAKLMNKFFLGLFDQEGVYADAPSVFRDAALTGMGVYKVCAEGDRIRIRRTFKDALIWDDADAVAGAPRCLYERRYYSREQAKSPDFWPQYAKEIDAAPPAKGPDGAVITFQQADLIEVIEAWHLPSSPNSNDGKHAIVIDGASLMVEEYELECFPFAWMFFGPRPTHGLCPKGLAAILVGCQIAINQHLDAIEQSLRLMAVPRVFIDDLTDIPKAHWNNAIGSIFKYAHGSNPPIIDEGKAVSPALFQHLYWLIEAGFQQAGLSELSVGAVKPEGLNSGKAIREFQDIESIRFAIVQQSYEQMFVQLAKVCMKFAKKLYGSGVDISAKVPGSKFLESVKFSEIDLDESQYEITVWPTSMLPKQPAARFATVDEYVQKGWVTREKAMQLLDFPDLDKANQLWTAQVEDAEATVDDILWGKLTPEERKAVDRGDDEAEAQMLLRRNAPDPLQNLPYGISVAKGAYLRARHQPDVKEARRRALLDWVHAAEELLTQAEQMQGQMTGGMAQGAPPPPGAAMPMPGAGAPMMGAAPPM